MKLINKTTGETIAEIMTNRSMSIDDALALLSWTVDDEGELFTESGDPAGAYYEEIEMVY